MSSTRAFDRAAEQLLRRDRQVVLAGLVLIAALAWAYLVYLVLRMDMGGMDMGGESMAGMMQLAPWSATDALLMFVMWAVMMVGMMLPSATPMVLLYARVVRHNAEDDNPLTNSGAFLAGYVIVWTLFSAAATTLQWGLEQAALLSPMMVSTSPTLGGLLLIAAAVYQWTPYKDACLQRCRAPAWFLSKHWRNGAGGALRMGLIHGAYCLGCCWSLMLLLFVGGVMNLLVIAAITIFVLLEKVAPRGRTLGRAGALLLGGAGFALLVGT